MNAVGELLAVGGQFAAATVHRVAGLVQQMDGRAVQPGVEDLVQLQRQLPQLQPEDQAGPDDGAQHRSPLALLEVGTDVVPNALGDRLAVQVAAELGPGDALVQIDVALGDLDPDLVVQFGNVVVGDVALSQPEPKELLVQAFGLVAPFVALLVGIGDPVAGRVGGMDLVSHGEGAVSVESHLVLGVDQDQALPGG